MTVRSKTSEREAKVKGSVSHNRATVSWGPRQYGSPTIVANAPVDAAGDLVAAVAMALIEIRRQQGVFR